MGFWDASLGSCFSDGSTRRWHCEDPDCPESAHSRMGICIYFYTLNTLYSYPHKIFIFLIHDYQEPSNADNLQDIHVVASNMITELALLCKTVVEVWHVRKQYSVYLRCGMFPIFTKTRGKSILSVKIHSIYFVLRLSYHFHRRMSAMTWYPFSKQSRMACFCGSNMPTMPCYSR